MAIWDTNWANQEEPETTTSQKYVPRCYESHPTLLLGKSKLSGGSASHPKVKDADVYISLQAGSTCDLSSDPWEDQAVVEVHYPIQDSHAPSQVKRFKKMITWICNQLHAGKHVHVGCIGGHGRTGTVLSAIVAEFSGKKDAIQWVREHYCHKAVESQSQVDFLIKHYDVKKAKPSKDFTLVHKAPAGFLTTSPSFTSVPRLRKESDVVTMVPEGGEGGKTFPPMSSSPRSLWKRRD